MSEEEAKQIIAQVCAQHNGPLAVHQRIQTARRVLNLLTAEEVATTNGHRDVEETVEA